MPHLAEHELFEYMDRETHAGRRADVEQHVQECQACAARLEGLRTVSRELTAALREFDVAPGYGVDVVWARRKSRGQRHLALRALAKAAVLVFVVGGAGAAAIPGSPVRPWLDDAWSGAKSVLGLAVESQPAAPSGAARPESGSRSTGIAVPLVDGRVRIDLRDVPTDAVVRVSVTARAEAAVLAEGASYRTGSGWIEVRRPGPAPIRIEIPARAEFAVVSVDGIPSFFYDVGGVGIECSALF
jgi:hypothetical protein